MSLIRYKFNFFLIVCIIFCLVLLFVDDGNWYYFFDTNDNLVIDEVDTFNDSFVIDEVNISAGESNKSNVILINNDRWVFPVSGGYDITTYYSSWHNAIDIYGYNGYGSEILAAKSGTVVSVHGGCYRGDVNCNGRGGNYVVIRHVNNYYSVYMHLAHIVVSVGDVLSSSDVIGTMGNTGNVFPVPSDINPYLGTHLHFAIYVGEPYNGGYAVDPLSMY